MLNKEKRRLFRRKPRPQEPDARASIEQITNALIAETVGPDGALQQELARQLRFYDAQTNPLGLEAARQILTSLVRIAVSQRAMLPGRIEASVECGDYFGQYYQKLQDVNCLTVEAYMQMKRMQSLRGEYLYSRGLYRNVLGKAYQREILPDSQDLRPGAEPEIWTALRSEALAADAFSRGKEDV